MTRPEQKTLKPCSLCGEPIYFELIEGKWFPFNRKDGSHFCPEILRLFTNDDAGNRLRELVHFVDRLRFAEVDYDRRLQN